MYVTKSVLGKLNLPMVILLGILTFAVSGLAAMAAARPASAATQPHSYGSALASDDGCYSTINTTGKFIGQSLGMVNAVVNVPVFDWDQSPSGNARYMAYAAANQADAKGALRGAMGGDIVGYAENFNFRTTPIPNLYWMSQYVTKQLPYDAAQLLAMIPGGPSNPYANSGFGTKSNPYIANPFLYQQASVLGSNGLPLFPVFTGDGGSLGGGWWSGGVGGIFNAIQMIMSGGNSLLGGNSGIVDDVGENQGSLIDQINNAMDTTVGTASGVIGQLLSVPPLNMATISRSVDGANPRDNCRETVNGGASAKSVPSYAFSVVNAGVPITFPGTLYGTLTLFLTGTFSMSGITIYPSSLNGKTMLDCYGRGKQPMIGMKGGRIGNLAGSDALNFGIALIAYAALLNPATNAIAQTVLNLPRIGLVWENYYNGIVFAFSLAHQEGGQSVPAVSKLPDALSNRVVDYSRSKTFDVNLRVLLQTNGTHNESQNGALFNPDLYTRLKEPYVLDPSISFDDTTVTNRDRGDLDITKTINVKIDTTKHGFDSDTYEERKSRRGGPTYDNNTNAKNTDAFSNASVYRIVMKPGVIPNAIDAGKATEGNQAYKSGDAPSSSADVCGFFQSKLDEGDMTTGIESSLTRGNNANRDREAWTQDGAYDCQFAKDADGNSIENVPIKMTESDSSSSLLNFEEKIPAETEPGTKICYAVFYDSYTNDSKFAGAEWWTGSRKKNADYDAPAIGSAQFLTKANCIISGYKPSMQTRGGDLMVTDGGIYGGVNEKDFIAGADGETRKYGSWGEYGVIATGEIEGFGSGSIFRTGAKSTPVEFNDMGYMTFSNDWGGSDSSRSKQYGHYSNELDDGYTRVARQFTEMNADDSLTTIGGGGHTVNLNDLARENADDETGAAKVFVLQSGVTNVSTSDNLGEKQSIVLLVPDDATVNINSNIEVPTEYASVDNLSQVVFAPATTGAAFDINVNHRVSRVDSWLINPNGRINTCKVANLDEAGNSIGDRDATDAEDVQKKPMSKGWCDNTLSVNGAVSAGQLILRRNGGKDQSSDPAKIEQSIAAENFNLRADAYLWSINLSNNSNRKFITTNSIDLPPRY